MSVITLRHVDTGEISSGHWLRDDSADNWTEVPAAEIELMDAEKID